MKIKKEKLSEFTVQHLPAVENADLFEGRLETGVVQVDDDWPGVFIRGDNAFAYRGAIDRVLMELSTLGHGDDANLHSSISLLYGLHGLLKNSDMRVIREQIEKKNEKNEE